MLRGCGRPTTRQWTAVASALKFFLLRMRPCGSGKPPNLLSLVTWLQDPSTARLEPEPPAEGGRETNVLRPASRRSSLTRVIESRRFRPCRGEGAGSPAGSGCRDGGGRVRVGALCQAGGPRLPHPAASHQPWLQVIACRRARLTPI